MWTGQRTSQYTEDDRVERYKETGLWQNQWAPTNNKLEPLCYQISCYMR